jgi:tetratricopeptide (TPR) repeat protein
MRHPLPVGFKKRGLWFLVSVLLALHAPRSARAEAAATPQAVSDMALQSDEPAGYRERIDEALREFSVQNYEEARSLFLQAHQLSPSARTLRALGLCEYELRNYGESIKYLEGALASRVKPLNETMRRDGERMIARSRSFVARVSVELLPAGARLMVDGVKVEAPDEPLWLSMGEHTLDASAPGFVSEKRKLNVKGGEEQKLSFILMAGAGHSADADASDSKAPSEKRWYKSPWLWVSLGVVVAGAGVATAVMLTRDNDSDRNGGTTGEFLPTH